MEFGITQVSYVSCQEEGIDDGIFVGGLVQRIQRDGVTHYAILDGGWWSHPILQLFEGDRVALSFNRAAQRLEVQRSVQNPTVLIIMDVAQVSEPIKLIDWLASHQGTAIDLRMALLGRRVPLVDSLFCQIPDGVIIAEGLVQWTMGALNYLGGDAEVIKCPGRWFYVQLPPSFLLPFVGKQVVVKKQRGRLVAVEINVTPVA
jgi:hypothetical protein